MPEFWEFLFRKPLPNWSKGWRCEERFWTLLTSCVLPGRGCKALQVSCELDQWGKRRDHLTINYKHPGCQPADRGEKQAWVDIFLPWTWSFVQPSVLKNLICYDVLLRPAWNHFSTRCTLSFKAAGTKKKARNPRTWSINWVNIKQSNILLTILHVDCGGHIDDINFHVIHLAFYPGSDLARLSMVPPHLVDGRGNSFRSALIPFCAFDGNMTTLGQPIDGLDFPACNQTWYCGCQLCYTLDVKEMQTEGKIKTAHGKGSGLLLLVDPGSYFLIGESKSKEKAPRNIISTKNIIPEHYISYSINNLVRNWSPIQLVRHSLGPLIQNSLINHTGVR